MSRRVLAANFERALRAAPNDSVRWLHRALFHEEAGRYEAAAADLQRAVALSPNLDEACNWLARLYLTGPEKLRDPHQAVALAERAVKRRPGIWAYSNTLGIGYYRAGRYQDAIKALETSLKGSAGQSDSFDLYLLAASHQRLGHADRARALFAQARAWHKQRQDRLSPVERSELKQFQSEAEAVLDVAKGSGQKSDQKKGSGQKRE